ncbi:MAG: hypothetical protein IT376_22705 [Polyangiaceae bacterium]|nr:hypothetical protein [Polyangiaceae bacterium]
MIASYQHAGRETLAVIAEALLGDAGGDDAGPVIEVHEGQAGRETLAAITADLLVDVATTAGAQELESGIRPVAVSVPEVTLGLGQVGRETLAAIDADLAGESAPLSPRTPMTTLDYGDRVPDPRRQALRGYSMPPPKAAAASPAVQGGAAPSAAAGAIDVFEMITFVVRGADLGRLASQSARREFVRERLLRRLPVESLDAVDRIDVTPWTEKGSVVVRVWCRVAE